MNNDVDVESSQGGLLYDAPLEDPSEDTFGRNQFARSLARAIAQMEAEEGFVFALQGPWGSGKTTTLNFVLNSLEEITGGSDKVVPIRFNPWWFSGQEQLFQKFFSQFRAALGDEDYGAEASQAAEHLEAFSKLVSPATLIPGVSGFATVARETARGIAQGVRGVGKDEQNVHELRQRIDECLREADVRFLVVVDDIDRLPGREIRQIFQLVKAVADFPSTIYLLAYDSEVVVPALDREVPETGRQYLEKIMQIPFDMPPPPRAALRSWFTSELDQILARTPNDLFDQRRWGNVYFDGVDELIDTPRDVVRLLNAIRSTYGSVREEVNAVDFIGVQALRVFAPEFYQAVSTSRELLTGRLERGGRFTNDQREEHRTTCEGLLDVAPDSDRETIHALMKRLFPKWDAIFGGAFHAASFESRWRRECRLCSSEVFNTYFRLTVYGQGISRAEVQDFLAITDDPARLRRVLLSLANQETTRGVSRVRALLERLEDYTEEGVGQDDIPTLIEALYDVGDRIVSGERNPGMFSFPDEVQIGRLRHQLLERIDDQEHRFAILRDAIENAESLAIPGGEVKTLQQGVERAQEAGSDEDTTVNEVQLHMLQQMVVEKIGDAADEGTLQTHPRVGELLYRWKEWGGDQEAFQEVVDTMIESAQRFTRLISSFSRTVHSHALRDRVATTSQRVGLDQVSELLGYQPDELADRADEILDADIHTLDDGSQTALRSLIREHEHPSEFP